MNEKNKINYKIVFMIIPIISNLIAVIASFGLNDLIFVEAERARFMGFIKIVPWAMWLINIFPFSVAAIVVTYFLLPLIYELKNFEDKKKLSEKAASRLLNAPLVISLIGMGGWVLGNTIAVSLQIYYIQNVTLRGMLVTVANTLSLGGIAFVSTYYTLDYINRKNFIQYYIKETPISKIQGVIKPPIVLRFFIFFFSVTVLPILILTLMISRSSLAGFGNIPHPLLIVPLIMIFVGSILSWLLARAFNKPLLEMKEAVSRIQEGKFDITVGVTTTDELGLLGEGISQMAISLHEKEFIKETFGKLVDPVVRDHLLNGNIKLGGEIRIATILFCDLRGFTSLSEQLSPIQIVEMLNTHFETMSKCIEEEGGLINKFIGDAIMAIYNVPVARQNHAERAFISARRMLESLELMNSGFQKRGLPELKIGIGLHTGEVLAGNIGSSSRLEYTVIGDTVNVASRIESLCKETKRSLLVSEATKAQLPVNTPLDSLGAFQLKGREEMIQIFAG
jgi:adenylate cyclase